MEKTLGQIYESALKFLLPLTPEETYRTIVKEAVKLTHAKYGSIFLVKNRKFQRVFSTVPEEYRVDPRPDGHSYQAFKKSKPIIISGREMRKNHPEQGDPHLRSMIIIPLAFDKRSLGILTLHAQKEQHFTKETLHILKLFGSVATLKIRNIELFNQTRKALEVRDLFLAVASHELRTPLTTIKGYVDLCKKKMAKGEMPKTDWIEAASSETHRLVRLTKELLEVNLIKSGKFPYEFREQNVFTILNRLANDVLITYPKYNILIQNHIPLGDDQLVCDIDKILQTLINIIDNSAKFSPEGSTIRIEVQKNSSHFDIVVSDQGKGIPQKDITHIFNGFYKGANHTKEGLGLGLFISKTIIDAHRGTIFIESQENQGTEVTISLPMHYV